ncbi:hypothetical protein [Pedobacter sp. UBA4863]|uniref:sialidase family protein n=1 Tax=Pedobacter sp. UBA4863 TaxID=1947060 RepID=UPI0025DFEC10|nr:hypothetical protein [Pedobacter sp. UBA4863]
MKPIMMANSLARTFFSLTFFLLVGAPSFSQVKFPGIVVAESKNPFKERMYSPSIVVLPDGSYVVSQDMSKGIGIHKSTDKGLTWKFITKIDIGHWGGLFVHKDALYIMGTSKSFGDIIIYRSTDGGNSWTKGLDENNGLLFKGRYHTAPVPVVVHNGRIWRAYEETIGDEPNRDFHALVISAPVDADLLKASSWTRSNSIRFEEKWINAKRPNWLEGNVVVAPNGKLIDFMRLETWLGKDQKYELEGAAAGKPRHEVAAVISVSDDGKKVSFDSTPSAYVLFPGAETKFTIRFDPVSKLYWTAVNKITYFDKKSIETYNGNWHQRNLLALYSSKDLKNWEEKYHIVKWNAGTPLNTWDVFGFQYADWQFEGNDIVLVSRSSWYGARYHDANLITFHRIKNFRNVKLSDSPADLYPLTITKDILTFDLKKTENTLNSIKSSWIEKGIESAVINAGKGVQLEHKGAGRILLNALRPTKVKANAIDNEQFIAIELSIADGYKLNIASIDLKLGKNLNETVKTKWHFSVNGGKTFKEITNYDFPLGVIDEKGTPQSKLYLSGYKELQNINANQKLILRMYFFGYNNKEMQFSLNDYLKIGGTVTK